MSTAELIANVKLETVKSVYSGKAGKCCCGCAGSHKYASKHVEAASKQRGYEVTPDEVSDRSVAMIFNKIKSHDARFSETAEINDTYMAVEIGNRLYIAYFLS